MAATLRQASGVRAVQTNSRTFQQAFHQRRHPSSCVSCAAGRCRHVCAAAPPSQGTNVVKYDHLLLAILDSNPYLSEGSRQAVSAAADLKQLFNSKLTILLVDEKPVENPESTEQETRLQTLTWHLKEKGCQDFEVVEKAVQSKSSVVVGDVADELSADLVLMSADAVHGKHIDANLLVEFVPCPVLLLP